MSGVRDYGLNGNLTKLICLELEKSGYNTRNSLK
nr:MAG TPA: hypothetical protein [Caudoviricetes sp.]DAV60608.1 MAG TPA: hypothetical protein [Caudoviricetes sp.]DAW18814.1 MAG TPA: hypothetical protein [Bacteriophage sp.]